MLISRTRVAQATVAGALALASNAAIAGSSGMILHEPFATPVPAIGGVGLVALAMLLSVVAVRLFKRSGAEGSKFLITAIGVTALAAGSGGVKLISDAQAVYVLNGVPLVVNSGGAVDVPDAANCYSVFNDTDVQQRITQLQPGPGWAFVPCDMLVMVQGGGQGGMPFANGGLLNGGGFRGTCNDNPGTVLGVGDFCTIAATNTIEATNVK